MNFPSVASFPCSSPSFEPGPTRGTKCAAPSGGGRTLLLGEEQCSRSWEVRARQGLGAPEGQRLVEGLESFQSFFLRGGACWAPETSET